jgi:predicted Zn-dependent protease
MEAFLLYALKCNNPRKAYEMAEELLRLKSDDKVALTVRMLVSADSGKVEEAQQIARKIQNLERNQQSLFYQTASKVLTIDPNQ